MSGDVLVATTGGRRKMLVATSGQWPGMVDFSYMSYNAQDSPHDKELSGLKCQKCQG